ncbi:hypothetical protein E1212_15220 [Jiangella ureilytica]|uniref:Uncharacterized protein n=1 Tax=Jiangella ureilytica TaxID=2530374 RepID=A0A4R4RNV5_9ACTN|nr:hypothetical protein [Jiangella ureilytica]TDC50382.1 hypothetical protein E1212_15220 [Jiangella ureilytica]
MSLRAIDRLEARRNVGPFPDRDDGGPTMSVGTREYRWNTIRFKSGLRGDPVLVFAIPLAFPTFDESQ